MLREELRQKALPCSGAGAVQSGLVVMPSQYPSVYRENVTTDIFGTMVADPYRWLEDTDSNETMACAHQNQADCCMLLTALPAAAYTCDRKCD